MKRSRAKLLQLLEAVGRDRSTRRARRRRRAARARGRSRTRRRSSRSISEHALVEAVEQPLEAVAVLLERVEELLELPAHPLDRQREAADLVGEAVVRADAEVALADRLGRARDAREPPRDQRRDQEAERGADREREQRRLEELVTNDAELLVELGPQRVGRPARRPARRGSEADDERRAVVCGRRCSGWPVERGAERLAPPRDARPVDALATSAASAAGRSRRRRRARDAAAGRDPRRLLAQLLDRIDALQRLGRGNRVPDGELLGVGAERALRSGR